MQLYRFGILLALLVPGVALAQPVITITHNEDTTANRTIINAVDCGANIDVEDDFFDVTVALGAAPLSATTVSIKLGKDTCPDANCVNTNIIDEPITQATQTFTVSLTPQQFIDAAASAGASCEDVDEKLFLFVEVEDATGLIGDEESDDIFVDTKPPLAPTEFSASGGENVLHVNWDSVSDNNESGAALPPQEHTFIVNCKIRDSAEALEECSRILASGTGPFTTDITDINGQELENGVEIEFQIITQDAAGNQSLPSASGFGTPQDVLDFGENYGGSETGGCSVGHHQSQLLWAGLALMAIVILRRQKRKA